MAEESIRAIGRLLLYVYEGGQRLVLDAGQWWGGPDDVACWRCGNTIQRGQACINCNAANCMHPFVPSEISKLSCVGYQISRERAELSFWTMEHYRLGPGISGTILSLEFGDGNDIFITSSCT
jgi:hypothetical protein